MLTIVLHRKIKLYDKNNLAHDGHFFLLTELAVKQKL